MNAGRVVDGENLSAAESIIRAAENHAPDANRMLVLIRLARLVQGDDCLVYASVEWIAHHTRLSVSTVERIVAEFRGHGIMQIVGTTGKGGSNIHRIDHERIADVYPQPESWEERRARSQAQFKAAREKHRTQKQTTNAPSQRGSVNEDAPSRRSPRSLIDRSTLPHCEGQGFKSRV